MNPIKKRIADFLEGKESCTMEEFAFFYNNAKNFIEAGIESDADALICAHRENKKIFLVGVVGKSFIQGDILKDYLESYFADAKGLKAHLSKITQYIYEDTQGGKDGCMILHDSNTNWRSFLPLKTIDDFLPKNYE